MGLSNIQWTDYTFNPWIGCRKVADECKNCYAETLDKNRFSKTMPGCSKEAPISHWGSGPRYRTSESNWREPLKWNKAAAKAQEEAVMDICAIGGGAPMPPSRPRVFCASLSDWLDDENVPIEWLGDLLKLIHSTPHLDWLLLTKRPQNWRSRIGLAHDSMSPGEERAWISRWVGSKCLAVTPEPPANVWIGVSAGADQRAALSIPAKIHFLSCEPMLRPLNAEYIPKFQWVIFGGESGSKARQCHLEWIRDAIRFCRENNVATFLKQLGSNCIGRVIPWVSLNETNLNKAGYIKDSHGGNMEEWPEDLRVREFPITKP